MLKEIRTIALGAVAAASLAGAQTTAPAPAPQAAAAPYSSAFEGYRPFAADEVGDWRRANETVREIGGWRAYAREIQGGSPGAPQPWAAPAAAHGHGHAAPPARAPGTAAPANPHQGHTR